MKRCPTCFRVSGDDSLRFCRHDGAPLFVESPAPDEATKLFDSESLGSEDWPATGPHPSGSARRAIDSLAVLPLLNESDEPNTEYLCDGITESIINSLSQLPKLRVLPRSIVSRYRGSGVEPQTIGPELGARAVLTGLIIKNDE